MAARTSSRARSIPGVAKAKTAVVRRGATATTKRAASPATIAGMKKFTPASPTLLQSFSTNPALNALQSTFVGLATNKLMGQQLSYNQWAILYYAASHQNAATVKGMATALKASKPGITKDLFVMEKYGLLSRQPDPADKRSIFAICTPAGAKLVQFQANAMTREFTRWQKHAGGTTELTGGGGKIPGRSRSKVQANLPSAAVAQQTAQQGTDQAQSGG